MGRLDYTTYWGQRGFSINKKLKEREVIMRDHIPEGSAVLDIGSGNSRLPLVLKERGCDIEVADVSSAVLEGFKEHGIPSRVLDLDKVRDVSFPKTYDYMILSEVLEHTMNPEEILATLSPHTRRFLLTVPNSAFYPFRFTLFFGGRFFRQWAFHPSEHVRFWSHTDFLDWLSVQGLSVEWSIPSNGLSMKGTMPWLKNVWPNLFGHQIVYQCKTNTP